MKTFCGHSPAFKFENSILVLTHSSYKQWSDEKVDKFWSHMFASNGLKKFKEKEVNKEGKNEGEWIYTDEKHKEPSAANTIRSDTSFDAANIRQQL